MVPLLPRHGGGADRGGFWLRIVPRDRRQLFLDAHGQRGPEDPSVRAPVRPPDPRHDRLGDRLILTAVDVGADR